jgi:hypothetical protein
MCGWWANLLDPAIVSRALAVRSTQLPHLFHNQTSLSSWGRGDWMLMSYLMWRYVWTSAGLHASAPTVALLWLHAVLVAYCRRCGGVPAHEMLCVAQLCQRGPVRLVWFYWSKNSQNAPLALEQTARTVAERATFQLLSAHKGCVMCYTEITFTRISTAHQFEACS